MLQDEYRQLYKRINKGWEDSVSLYKKLINKQIDKTTVVLDAGCGFSDLLKEEYERCKKVIGVDISPKFLAKNEWVDVKIVANLESIPKIRDNSIDVIVSSWVFEHLKNPNRVFSEFYRILKKGGKLIFLTPNALNGVILLNKMIPSLVRKFLIGKMSKDLETDPMEAFYKANSLMALKRLAETKPEVRRRLKSHE